MFYVKLPKIIRTEKSYKINNLSNFLQLSYNTHLNNAVLENGAGIKSYPINFPINVYAQDIFRWGTKVVAVGSDNALYDITNKTATKICDLTFSKKPNCIGYVEGGEVKLLATDGITSVLISKSKTIKISVPYASNLTAYAGTMFATNNYNLYFSNTLNSEFWMGKGKNCSFITIENIGKILNLVVLDDLMYIFCEHGIARLDAFCDREDYKLEFLNVPFFNYYQNTAKRVDEKIYFVADNEIYYLQNSTVKKSNCIVPPETTFINSTAGGFHGNYYVTANVNSISKNEVILVCNESKGIYAINSGNVKITCDNYVINTDNFMVGLICSTANIFSNKNIGYYLSKPINFGTNKKKLLSEVYINTLKNVKVTVRNAKKSKTVTITPQNKRAKINLYGEYFTVEILSNSSSFIDSIEFIYYE